MYTARNIQTCTNLAVASQSTGVWTYTFRSGYSLNFGIWIKCAGDAIAIRVQLEHSYISLTSDQQLLTNSNYIVPDAFPDVFSDIVDTNAHYKSITPCPTMHLRYKMTGLAGNAANATVTIVTFSQEPGMGPGIS